MFKLWLRHRGMQGDRFREEHTSDCEHYCTDLWERPGFRGGNYVKCYTITITHRSDLPYTQHIKPQTTVVLPICSIETCMYITSLYRPITNQTNLVSKILFERDRISFVKQHVARIRLTPSKVKVQVYEYHHARKAM